MNVLMFFWSIGSAYTTFFAVSFSAAEAAESRQVNRTAFAEKLADEAMRVFDTSYASKQWDRLLTSSVAVAYRLAQLGVVTTRMTFNLTNADALVDVSNTGPVFPQFISLSWLTRTVFSDTAEDIQNLQQQMKKLKDTMWFVLKLLQTKDANLTEAHINGTLARVAQYFTKSEQLVNSVLVNLGKISEKLSQVEFALASTNEDAKAAAAEKQHLTEQRKFELKRLSEKQAIIQRFKEKDTVELQNILTPMLKHEKDWLETQTTGFTGLFLNPTIVFLKQTVDLEYPEFEKDKHSLEELEADGILINTASRLISRLNQTLQLTLASPVPATGGGKCVDVIAELKGLVSEIESQGNQSRYARLFNTEGLNSSLSQVCTEAEGFDQKQKPLLEVTLNQISGAVASAVSEYEGQTSTRETVSGFPAKILARAVELVIKMMNRIKERTQKLAADTKAEIEKLSSIFTRLVGETIASEVLKQSVAALAKLLGSLTLDWQVLRGELQIFRRPIKDLGGVSEATTGVVFEVSHGQGEAGAEFTHVLSFMGEFMFYVMHSNAIASLAGIYANVFRHYVIPALGDLHEGALAQTPEAVARALEKMNTANAKAQAEVSRLCADKKKALAIGMKEELDNWSEVLASFLYAKAPAHKREVAATPPADNLNVTDKVALLKICYADEALLADLPAFLMQMAELLTASKQWVVTIPDSSRPGMRYHVGSSVTKLWKTVSETLGIIRDEMETIESSFARIPNLVGLTVGGFHEADVALLRSRIVNGVESSKKASEAVERVSNEWEDIAQKLLQSKLLNEQQMKSLNQKNAAVAAEMKTAAEILQLANETLSRASNESATAQEQFNKAVKAGQDSAGMAGVRGFFNIGSKIRKTGLEAAGRVVLMVKELLDPQKWMTNQIGSTVAGIWRESLQFSINKTELAKLYVHSKLVLPDQVALLVTAALAGGIDKQLQNVSADNAAETLAALESIESMASRTNPVLRQYDNSTIVAGLSAHVNNVQQTVARWLMASPPICLSSIVTDVGCTNVTNVAVERANAELGAAVASFNQTLLEQLSDYYEQQNITKILCHARNVKVWMDVRSLVAVDLVQNQFRHFIPPPVDKLGQKLQNVSTVSEIDELLSAERVYRMNLIGEYTADYIKCKQKDMNGTLGNFIIPAGHVLINATNSAFAEIRETAVAQLLEEQTKWSNWSIHAMNDTRAVAENASNFLVETGTRLGLDAVELEKLREGEKVSKTDAIGEYEVLAMRMSEYISALASEEKSFTTFLQKLDDEIAATLASSDIKWEVANELQKQSVVISTQEGIAELRKSWIGFRRFFETIRLVADAILDQLGISLGSVRGNADTPAANKQLAAQHLATLQTMAIVVRLVAAGWSVQYDMHIKDLVMAVHGLSTESDAAKADDLLAVIGQAASNATTDIRESARNSFANMKDAAEAEIKAFESKQKRQKRFRVIQ